MSKNTHKYISTAKLENDENKKKKMTIIGGVLTTFFALSTIMAITGYNEEIRNGLIVYVIFLIPSVILLYKGIELGKQIGITYRYDAIFSGDRDGIVTIDELQKQLGKTPDKIFLELEKLFNNGYIINCTLQREGNGAVIINDATVGEDGVGFKLVKCDTCGGYTKIRAGTHGQCKYCRAGIFSKE